MLRTNCIDGLSVAQVNPPQRRKQLLRLIGQTVRLNVHIHQRGRLAAHNVLLRQFKHQRPVLQAWHVLVKRRVAKCFRLAENTLRTGKVCFQQVYPVNTLIRHIRRKNLHLLPADTVHAAENDIRARFLQERQLPLQLVGVEAVVAVLKGDVLPLCRLTADIPRVARAAVFRQTDDAQARITDFRQHPRRVIGRRVIDDDALDIPFRLIEDALDRFSDSISSIIRWQHHRNHDSHPRFIPHSAFRI